MALTIHDTLEMSVDDAVCTMPGSAAHGTPFPKKTGHGKASWTSGSSASDSEQSLAQAIDQFTIGRRQVVVKAIDGFDDNAPLGETGDGAQGIEPRLHFHRHTNAQLRVVLYLFAFPGASRGATGASSVRLGMFVGHGYTRLRGTAEIRAFRRVSNTCQQQWNASDNVMVR